MKKDQAASSRHAVDVMEQEAFNIRQASEVVVSGVEKNTVSNSITTPKAALSSSGQVDITLKSSVINTVKGLTLVIVNKNSTDTALALPANAFDQIKYINIKANNGQTTICKLNKETLLYPMRFLDQDTLGLYRQGFMSDTNETLAASATRTYYLPLIGDVFALNELFLAGIDGDITYEVYFDSGAWAGVVPDLEKLYIITRHQKYDFEGQRQMTLRYSSMFQEFRYRELVEMNFNQTLSPSGTFEFILSQFSHPGSEIYIQIFETGDLLGDLVQYVQTYDLEDADSQSIIASQAVDADYHKIILNAAHDVSNVMASSTSDPWLIVPLSSNSADDYVSGGINGYHDFVGKEKLIITTKSTLVEGTYTVRIYYAKIRTLSINQGEVRVST